MLETFISGIESRPLVIDDFDEKLWTAALDKIAVLANGRLIFSFKNGTDIES